MQVVPLVESACRTCGVWVEVDRRASDADGCGLIEDFQPAGSASWNKVSKRGVERGKVLATELRNCQLPVIEKLTTF